MLQVSRKKLTVLASMVSLAKTEASAAKVPAKVAVKIAEAPVPLLAAALRTAAGVFRGRYPAIVRGFLYYCWVKMMKMSRAKAFRFFFWPLPVSFGQSSRPAGQSDVTLIFRH